MRAHPLGVALLLVGSVLSIATTDYEIQVPVHVESAPVPGSVTLEPGVSATVTYAAEVSCAWTAEPGAPLPLQSLGVLLTPEVYLDEETDSGAPAWVRGTLSVDGEPWVEDERYSTIGAGLRLDASLPLPCFVGERCAFEVAVTLEADAAAHATWEATAHASWSEQPGFTCLVLLSEV